LGSAGAARDRRQGAAPYSSGITFPVIASEAKQSSFLAAETKLDCFVASFFAMTVETGSFFG
jgi:hypothetical protein